MTGYGDDPGRRAAVTKVTSEDLRHVRMSGTDAAQRTAREQGDSPHQAVRAAWQSLRRAGLIAPELPSVLFVAVASCAGFWWGLGTGALAAAVVLAARLRRALPIRAVLGGTIGLAVAATIAYQTGVAASGLLADICIDLALAVVLAGSIAMRRPLLGVLWSLVRREPLLRQAERFSRRGYNLTTGIAAAALAMRSLALAIVYFRHEPVTWLLGVKLALGLPVTLVVVAAAYAASGLDSHDRATDRRTGQTEGT